jgi:hypothetical protein
MRDWKAGLASPMPLALAVVLEDSETSEFQRMCECGINDSYLPPPGKKLVRRERRWPYKLFY